MTADYPPTPRDATLDDYHGTPVADPYRWLEAPAAPETVAWVEAQNRRTRALLDAVPARERARARLAQLFDYPRQDVPYRRGERYFFSKNDGLQNQPVLYVQETLDAPARVILDPNTLSEDGTVAVSGQAISRDGALLAYALSESGSDQQTYSVMRIDGGEQMPDTIRWCKFASIAWKHDGSGFFYNRYPDPAGRPEDEQTLDNAVYWHALGTTQEADRLIYSRPDARDLAFSPSITKDGRYLVLYVWRGTDTQNRLYYRPVEGDSEVVRLLDDADARYDLVGSVGTTFYLHTDLDAPRGRVIAIDLERPERERWREIIPQGDGVLDFVTLVGGRLVTVTNRDVQHHVAIYDLDGAHVRDLALPFIGTVAGLSGLHDEPELLIGLTSFLTPLTVLRHDVATGDQRIAQETTVSFPLDDYVIEQHFATSRDGTRVPLFVVHRRGLVRDGSLPTLLYGYGGFDVSLMPSFNTSALLWLEAGGVYAQANLRGGSEYGQEWHRAGMLGNKQNVFDDFCACAAWLVEAGYTRPERLAIEGGSNGGLLVAACMLQRPELFGAVVCAVPVIDMLRYHRFTVGRYWTGEYGNAEEHPEHFQFLIAYSPLHNVQPGRAYPPTLITTADTDDRVVPAHAYKFAATLQHADAAGQNRIYLRVEVRAGHGAGKPIAKVLDEQADIYAFLFHIFGMAAAV